jgi:hypothetical protein
MTQAEVAEALAQRESVKLSRSSIKRALRRFGFSRKRKQFTDVGRETDAHRATRTAFELAIQGDPSRLVFLDESAVKTGIRREYGWSPRGSRAIGLRVARHWTTVSLLGAIRLGRRPQLMACNGA